MKTKKSPLVLTAIALAFALAFTACPIGPEPVPPEPVHVHQWGDWSVTTAATCSLAGVETRTCALDTSHTETQTIAIDPNAHVPGSNSTITKAATCEEDGVWSGTCALNSSHVLNNAVLSKLGHVWEWTTTTATEITDGQEGYICKNDSSHTKDNQIAYATGTAGLAFEAIGSTAYRVRKGTVTTGAVHIPAYHRPDANSPYLPVTEIGSGENSDYGNNAAFASTNITSVAFTQNSELKTIGRYAFSGCSSLTSITIPASVTVIYAYAFSGCTGLTGINIPASVTVIGQMGGYTFQNCTSLASITVDANNPNYSSDSGILYNKAKTQIVTVPQGISGAVTIQTGVTSIGGFSNCKSLISVTIPNSVTSIGNSAFSGCTSLTSVTIPSSVTSIGNNAFSDCTSLASITVDSGNTSFSSEGGILYNKAKTEIVFVSQGISGAVTIPTGVTYIGDQTFSWRSNLTSVTIPASVTSIGNSAFNNCTSLTSVTFEGTIASGSFSTSYSFPGDLRTKFYADNSANGTPGTYTRPNGTSNTWTRQP